MRQGSEVLIPAVTRVGSLFASFVPCSISSVHLETLSLLVDVVLTNIFPFWCGWVRLLCTVSLELSRRRKKLH